MVKKVPLKNPVGRPSKYDPKYCDEIIEFFSIDPYREVKVTKTDKQGNELTYYEDKSNDLRFISAFARKIRVNTSTIWEWSKKHSEFSYALKMAKDLQKEHLITCGLRGLFDRTFAIFTAKNIAGMRDKAEVNIVRVDRTRQQDQSQNTSDVDTRRAIA